MGLLLMMSRKMHLISCRNNLQMELMRKQQELYDYQTYSSAIGEGVMSTSNLMSMPNSVFGRSLAYINTAGQYAQLNAQEKFNMMLANGALNTIYATNPNANQQQMQQYVFYNLYQQSLEEFKKQEMALLNKKEKEIQMSITRLETRLKMVESELESVGSQLGEEAKNAAPKFGLG